MLSPRKHKGLLLLTALCGVVYYKRSILMYGLLDKQQIYDTVDKVVDCLGGGDNAKKLMLEVSAAETDMGNAIDKSWFTGIGLMQFDKIGFDDVLQRTSKNKKALILKCFGIDIDRVVHTDLRWSPLLSVIFARLKFMLVPGLIPNQQEDRARYWKKWYNSSLGAGTPEHYIKASTRHGLV